MVAAVAERTLLIDGRPSLVLAGEIHPFRLPRDGWGRRLDLLREAGADTVAHYIPWVVHEAEDGSIDLAGATRPELDLGAFLDAAAERGLRSFVRPGPFTMGELRHEGVPARVVREHPELKPVGWDGVPCPTADLDVASPAFLAEADRWYAALGSVLAPRVADGTIVGVQLDNEIGMLSWVSNTPWFTDDLLAELRDRVGGSGAYPGRDDDLPVWRRAVLTPAPGLAPDLRVDLAELHRERTARYVAALGAAAERHGFGGVPRYVNVHGTEAGRAPSLSIGISQLAKAIRLPGVVAGSDHYVGTLDPAGAADLHLAHAFLAAAAPTAPLTSLEHEAGTGDYGGDLAGLVAPEAVVQKTRLLLGQGARLWNWYLFAGGFNPEDPRSEDRPGEGHRFGITGERHGAAAPVTPEGERSPAFAPTAEAITAARDVAGDAAVWEPEFDDLVVGFVPGHFATEHLHPADTAGRELVEELRWARGGGPRQLLPRMLQAERFRFGAVDLESAEPIGARVLVLGTGDALDDAVQQRLIEHVRGGGGLLLVGDLPRRDLRGRPATALAEALGLRRREVVREGPGIRPAVRPAGPLAAAGFGTEVNAARLTRLESGDGTPVLVDALTNEPCGVEVAFGAGRAIVVAADGPTDPAWFRAALARLGATPAFTVEGSAPGLVLQTTRTPAGRRFLHLLDVGGYGQRITVREHGRTVTGPVHLRPRAGVILSLA